MTFQEFITGKVFSSLSLYHTEEEIEEYTLCDFGLESMTAEGAIYWQEVLAAEVQMVSGNSVWVKGVDAEQVEAFQAAHAGYCSDKDWDRWFQFVEVEDTLPSDIFIVDEDLDLDEDEILFTMEDGSTYTFTPSSGDPKGMN